MTIQKFFSGSKKTCLVFWVCKASVGMSENVLQQKTSEQHVREMYTPLYPTFT